MLHGQAGVTHRHPACHRYRLLLLRALTVRPGLLLLLPLMPLMPLLLLTAATAVPALTAAAATSLTPRLSWAAEVLARRQAGAGEATATTVAAASKQVAP